MRQEPRRQLLEAFSAALDAVNGAKCVRATLETFPLSSPVYLIALGKAACAMANGARSVLGDAIQDGLIITKSGYAEPLPWPVLEAAHPLPDERSLAAGDRLFEFIARLPKNAHVLVLLSGGASVLVEKLPDGIRLDGLREFNRWLLASGRDIIAINRLRKRLSLIKGGRLAQWLAPRTVTCLAISDVPGDDPRAIGSGPLIYDEPMDDLDIADAPDSIRAVLAQSPPLPRSNDPCFRRVRFEIVACLNGALQAAVQSVQRAGGQARCASEFIDGDALVAGDRLARVLLHSESSVIHVWGGETTVKLPPQPGRGGRSQSLALSAALALNGQRNIWFMAASTDGTDGPTSDAGALIDGETIIRGEAAGINACKALAGADAGNFLAASGDLIHTGPTGTNVMDLMLGIKG